MTSRGKNDEGWIDMDNLPSKSKRPRLSHHGNGNGGTSEDVQLVRICKKSNSQEASEAGRDLSLSQEEAEESQAEASLQLALASSPSSGASEMPIGSKRNDCRYGSNCYRRNETHLMDFRHRLLEKAFMQMKESNDFTKLPEDFDLEDGDGPAILEQAVILKDAGFLQSRPGSCVNSPLNSPAKSGTGMSHSEMAHSITNSSSPIPSTSTSGAGAGTSQKRDPVVAKLFEERRLRIKAKQGASDKVKEGVNANEEANAQNGHLKSKTVKITNDTCMADKWKASCPFNFFLTKVRDIPEEPSGVLSANFTDLFDTSFGEVKAVCHINYMVEASWLFDQTMRAGLEGKQTRIIYGDESAELEEGAKAFPWLKIFKAKSPFPYGHHHTKMSLVQYTDGSMRFYVYTANLIESDWDNRTQGIWISPKCPKVPSESPLTFGESPTRFRADIMQYLSTYPVQVSAAWTHAIKYIDCSEIRVFFVGSAPITSQSNLNGFQFGIKKMERVLRSYEMDTDPNWPLIMQCSSIGTLGKSPNDWLTSEFGAAMAGKDRTIAGSIDLVYPSTQSVKGSFDGVLGGGCLPYSAMTHMKQRWLDRHFRQWKADCSGRSRAPPHIKSYSRWSPDHSKMAWFLLTSANISKAAWGSLNKKSDRLTIMSWEAGVLFVPQLFGSSKYFTVSESSSENGVLRFPLHIDVPPVKYQQGDHPWFFETLKIAMSE